MSRFPTYIVTAIPMEFRRDAVMVIVIAIILLCLLMKLVSMNKEIRKLNSKISQIQDNRSAEDKEQNVISSPNGKNIILLVENASEAIAQLIMNLVRVTDPDTVVLGGGIISDVRFYEKVLSKLNANTMRFVSNGVVITHLNPDFVGLLGAGAVAMNM